MVAWVWQMHVGRIKCGSFPPHTYAALKIISISAACTPCIHMQAVHTLTLSYCEFCRGFVCVAERSGSTVGNSMMLSTVQCSHDSSTGKARHGCGVNCQAVDQGSSKLCASAWCTFEFVSQLVFQLSPRFDTHTISCRSLSHSTQFSFSVDR